jgi:uncharacterized protein
MNDSTSSTEVDLHWKTGTDPREGRWPGYRKDVAVVVDGMKVTWDVAVSMRDNVKIYVDIFQPESFTGRLPTLLTWSPYGKHGPKTFAMFPNSGVPEGAVSKYAAWEGCDPAYWTRRGYAVINGDARGSWGSEGDLEIFGQQEALDAYDLIEWAASLPWSNGRIGTTGVSYLAIVQWRIAETSPPHLACINPWEGFSDLYRDYSFHGGIPETNFVKFMDWSCRCSFGKVEDWVKMHQEHQLRDKYFASKSCRDLSKITVPAYVVADWGDQGLHTRGAIEGFTAISSPRKWLEVHGRKKWQYYYQESSLQRQEAFYQRFLKDLPSDVDSWPPVRIEVRNRAFDGVERGETEWPIGRTQVVKKYLDAASHKLTDKPPLELSVASYNATVVDDCLRFTYLFPTNTELTGNMRLRLWVSTDAGDDMDIFVQVDKLDTKGAAVPFVAMAMLDDGPLALGWLRVSHRELDLGRTTSLRPWLKHQRRLLVKPGEIVPVDIEIWPSSTLFHAGESLRLTVQGNDIFRYDLPQVQLHQDSVNAGVHSIYSSLLHHSYLAIPQIEAEL